VLLSLAARIPFETNPRELTALVVRQIEAALHPRKVAVLVSGLEDGKLTPAPGVAEHARALPQSGALATMLRWSEEPLELDVHDTRSPARRLPTDERSWLTDTGTVLLVPVFAGQDNERVLIGALGLGEKMSEEPYTGEDKELLSSIAAQVGLALDAARLRMAQAVEVTESSATTITPMPVEQLVECPECGRCESSGTTSCAADGSVMRLVPGLPRTVDSKYRIDQVLGRGGMGAVYRARDVRLERDVALKVVRLELLADPDARTRFRREAQIIARLQHPSLVSVFDYGTLSDGGAFLVMEFVKGHDLRTLLRSERRLEPVRTARLMRAVCDGMDVAHRAGVLHRDLKPENIFLPETGVEAKVLDFGIAKVIGDRPLTADHETLTVAGQPIGTPAYMAPEQLTGEMLSPQTDVFSLGVIAFELLTGELPFGRGSLLDIATRQQEGPPLIDGAALHIPPEVGGVVRAALQVMPGDRPTSPGLFADALTAAMDGAPS
jgi:predicted Ser/Thr protein kinase